MTVGLGCMRLSTASDRDEADAQAVLRAAFDAKIRIFDTAPSYAHGEHELGHNERLLRAALGDRLAESTCITKVGLTRRGQAFLPDGRRKAIEASAHASASVFGGALDVLLLHTVDPAVPLATSVRALEELRAQGLARSIGLCNVSRGQLEEALDLAELTYLQVAYSVLDDRNERSGVMGLAMARGLTILAHTPLGGPKRAARLASDPVLAAIARAHDATAAEVALAYLQSRGVVPLAGASRVQSVASLARAAQLTLSDDERAQIEERKRLPLPARTAPLDVVMLIGSQGSGKTSLVASFEARGYAVSSRDVRGGTLAGLDRAFEQRLATLENDPLPGFVLDNTAGTRAQRAGPIAIARRAGADVRAIWLETPSAVAQGNVVRRIASALGRLPSPDELRKSKDPRIVPPRALFQYAKSFEAPSLDEGFDSIERRAFERRARGTRRGLALSMKAWDLHGPWPEHDCMLIYGWAPQAGSALRKRLEAEAPHAELALCEHGEGPPVCWCRPPLPGLVAAWAELSDIDVQRSILIGTGRIDRTLADGVGLRYEERR